MDHWSKEGSRQKLLDKVLYVTLGSRCFKLTAEFAREEGELGSNQEEADTRLIFHAGHAAKQPFKSIIVSSEDTDVRVLCLAFSNTINVPIFQRSVSQFQARYIDINQVANAIGQDMCRALPGLHAFKGCDSVSAFAGVGRVKPFRMLRSNTKYQEIFKQVGNDWSVSQDLLTQLESFVCAMYGAKNGIKDVNQCRYAVFCAKRGEAESHQLPPCKDCLHKHCQRADYQAAIWKNASSNHDPPTPIGKGWLQHNEGSQERFDIDWMSGLPAPRAVIELMSCTCKKS